MPIKRKVGGRVHVFPDGTHESIIRQTLVRENPPTGAEIYAKAMFDPKWAADKMSRKEHKRMRAWQGEQDPERLKDFAEGFTHMLGEVASGTWEAGKNIIPHPVDTLGSLGAGAIIGTADLGMIVDKMFTLNAYDTYEKYLSGKGVSDTESARKDWEATMLDDYRDYRKQMNYMALREGAVKSTPHPKVVQAASYVLDPTLFIPAVGVGSKVATGLAGGAAKYAGEGLIEVAKGSGKGAAYGAVAGAGVGGLTGLATTGTLGGALTGAAALGVPGGLIGKYGVSNIGTIPERTVGYFSEEAGKSIQKMTGDLGKGVTAIAVGGLAVPYLGPLVGSLIGGTSAVKGLGATMRGAGEILQATGQSIKEGGRLGPLGGAARILDEGSTEQKFAQQLSRLDPMLGLAGAAGRGAAVGTGIGTGLGALAEGWDTPAMWQASGGGLGLGGFAGVLGAGISKATGAAYKVKLMQDLERFAGGRADGEQIMRFAETLSVKELPLMIDALGTLNHTSIHFVDNEGSKKVLSDQAALEGRVLTEAENQPFNGMVLSEPDANGVVQAFINVDSANATTVPHELLHALVMEEKKADFIAEVKTNLVGYRDQDGSVLQEGLLRPEELQAYAEAYAKNLLPELRAEFLAKVDEGLKGNRELLDQVVEEFAADYFVEFLKGKPREYLLRKGKPTVMQTIFNRASQLFTSRLRDDLNDMGVKFDFQKGKLQEGFYDDKGKRIRLKVLDDMLDTLVKAEKSVDADKSGGSARDVVKIKNMTPEQQKKLLKAQGADHFMTVDKDGNPVMRTQDEITSLEDKNAEAIVSALKEDAAETGAIFWEGEEGGKPTTFITLTDAAVRKLLDNPMLNESMKHNIALVHDVIMHPERGNIMQLGYFKATESKAKNPAKRVYASLGLSVRDVLPYQLAFNKEGGLYFKGVDWSVVRKRFNAVWKKPKVRELFNNDKRLFWNKLREYLRNLTQVDETGKPVKESAEIFGIERRDIFRETMGPRGDDPRNRPLDEYQIIPENQKEALHPYKSFRVDRMSKIVRKNEHPFDFVKSGPRDTYERVKQNFQPASFKPEKLPGGEAWMHESGYSILKKGRGKFRVYKPDHELLGIRDTMKSAASLAGRSSQKEVAKFQPSPEIDPLGMFSKAESAALELKQAKGSGQQMLSMLNKAGVKAEEMKYLGLDKFLEGKKSVTRDEIHDHIVQNQITVEETVLGGGEKLLWVKERNSGRRTGPWTEEEALSVAERTGGEIIKEIDKRGETATKHSSYVEPGAVEGSYRELLLRLPEKRGRKMSFDEYVAEYYPALSESSPYGVLAESARARLSESARHNYETELAGEHTGPGLIKDTDTYTSGHYGEYPNTLAHIRFNERTGPKGEKVLFVEEIQSDWHQAGRKKGYKDEVSLERLRKDKEAAFKEYKTVATRDAHDVGADGHARTGSPLWEATQKWEQAIRAYEEAKLPVVPPVPDAPFKTSWHELAMKRMIKYAVDNGYDAIAWTKGETQFSRYGSQEIAWVKDGDGWNVKATEQRGGEAGGIDIEGAARAEGILKEGGSRITSKEQLRDVVENTLMDRERGQWSKENFAKQVDKLTNRVWERMQKEDAGTSLPRKEGMKGFYDKMLPKVKTWKKLGMKVEEGKLAGKPDEKLMDQLEFDVDKLHDLEQGLSPDTARWREVVAELDAKKKELQLIQSDPKHRITLESHIVRLSPEAKAKVGEGMARFQPADSTYLAAVRKGDTATAQRLVDDAAKAAGYTSDKLFHGTTHKFNVFNTNRGNLENDFGLGHYFTTSKDDVAANYAGVGPDLTQRIELRAEALENEGVGRNTALKKAAQELAGGESRTIKAYVKTDNPAILGKDDRGVEMRLEPPSMYDEAAVVDKMPEIRKEIAKEEGVKPKEVEEYEVRQKAEEWADENGYYNEEPHPLLAAVETVARRFYDVEDVAKLNDVLWEEPTYAQIEDVLRKDVFQYAMDESGGMAVGEAIRQVFRELGHDGIIDRRVSEKFGSSRQFGQKMEGLYEGDFHVIVFNPNQIKSADPVTYNDAGKVIPLSERFDVGRDDIRFQPAESLTNGTAWRTADGYNVLQKGKRGKFRAYAPSGKLIGIYDQLKTAQKAAIRRLEKESGADQARFMPAGKKVAKDIELLLDKYDDGGHGIDTVEDVLVKLKDIIAEENVYELDDAITALNRAIDDDWDSAGRGGFKEEGEQKFLDTLEAFVAKNKKPKKPTKGGKAEKAKDLREELIRKGETAKQRRLKRSRQN